jgi:hypothetical protein
VASGAAGVVVSGGAGSSSPSLSVRASTPTAPATAAIAITTMYPNGFSSRGD